MVIENGAGLEKASGDDVDPAPQEVCKPDVPKVYLRLSDMAVRYLRAPCRFGSLLGLSVGPSSSERTPTLCILRPLHLARVLCFRLASQYGACRQQAAMMVCLPSSSPMRSARSKTSRNS